jgi:hypothetical protein
MAITCTARGTYNNNTSATTSTFSPSGNFAAGSWAVLVLSADNSGTSGTAENFTSVTDSLGNTWTERNTCIYDPGAANAGIQGSFYTTDQSAGTLTTGTTITVTFGAATVADCGALWEVIPTSGYAIAFGTFADGTGSATTTPTVTTSSITSGDIVIGGLFNEYGTAQTVTEDGDATNGAWSTQQTNEVGTTGSGNTVSSQYKVVTATATQTYNPTLGTSSDVILAWVSLTEAVIPAASGAPGWQNSGWW